ncbi:6-phospho-alpha-glucosidase, partial [Eubacterium sp. TM05-53]
LCVQFNLNTVLAINLAINNYEHSYQKAFEAFTLNRLINDAKEARKILDALIEANGDQWPELK